MSTPGRITSVFQPRSDRDRGAVPGVVALMSSNVVMKRPIREAVPSAREIHALSRVIAADKRGETIPYEQHRAGRTARLGRRPRQARAKAAR